MNCDVSKLDSEIQFQIIERYKHSIQSAFSWGIKKNLKKNTLNQWTDFVEKVHRTASQQEIQNIDEFNSMIICNNKQNMR